jgi:hypothetical protein
MSQSDEPMIGTMISVGEFGPVIQLVIGDGEEMTPDDVADWDSQRVTVSKEIRLEDMKTFIEQLISEVSFIEVMSGIFDNQELDDLEAEADEVLDDE